MLKHKSKNFRFCIFL